MPTYSYRCRSCNYSFEEFQAISAVSLTVCKKCKKNTLERLIGAGAGIVFKGTGFYVTDYKYKKDTPKTSQASSKTNPKQKNSESKKSTTQPSNSSGNKKNQPATA